MTAKSAFMEKWIASRPPSVQALARRFPVGEVVQISDDPVRYILGYTENEMLIVSQTDPRVDYDKAVATKEYLCADHVERA
jgi:hypothetical protein